METVCRLCSTQSSKLEAIFSFKNGRLISDLISTLIPIRCDINDPFPKKVCSNCLDIINKANELRETSFKTDESFRDGTFVIFPEKIPTETTIKIEEKGKRKDDLADDDNLPRKRQRTSTDDGCPYGCSSKSVNDVEKLSTIEEKLDKLMESVGCVDKLKLKMDHLEKKVSSQEHDLQSNKTFITNCLENAIGCKPASFPTKLCATNVSELNVVDRSLMNPQNNDYFIKYLNNNIGKSPDYKSYMKRALEIVMSSDFKAQLSFANHIRNLHAYNVIADCCSNKFNVSKKDIETYVARNIANLKNYNKQGKKHRTGLAETSTDASSSSFFSADETEIKSEVTECYFEVRELN